MTSEVLLLEVKGNTGKIFLETEIGMDDVARQRMQSKVQFRMSTFNNFAKIIQGEVNWTDSRSDFKKGGCGCPKKCFEAKSAWIQGDHLAWCKKGTKIGLNVLQYNLDSIGTEQNTIIQ